MATIDKLTLAKMIKDKIDENDYIRLADCQAVINSLGSVIEDGLRHDGQVVIRNFITIQTKNYPARRARNPKTGLIEVYPKYKRVTAKVSDKIKRAVNQN